MAGLSTITHAMKADPTFTVGTGFNGAPFSILKLDDGKYLVGGQHTTYNGVSQGRISRLNSDGTLDTTFNGGNASFGNGYIRPMLKTSDGKYIVSGNSNLYNGSGIGYVIRLNADGSKDTTFNTSNCSFSSIGSMAIAEQTDGKLLFTGWFTSYCGTAFNSIVRLNADGTIDTSFNVGSGFNNVNVPVLVIQTDGKILVGGLFTSYNGTTANRIIRLNTDGTVDSSFNSGTGFNSNVHAIKVQSDGKIIIGGGFTSYNGTTANRIIRLNSDGSVDSTFNSGAGLDNQIYPGGLAIDEFGRIVAGGYIARYNNINNQNMMTRINSDGSYDTSFGLAFFNNAVKGIVTEGDRITAVGDFTTYRGSSYSGIVRLIPDNPIVRLSTTASSTINGPVTITITPSSEITELTLTDFICTGCTVSNLTGSGQGPYSVTLTPTSNGSASIKVPSGGAPLGVLDAYNSRQITDSNTLNFTVALPPTAPTDAPNMASVTDTGSSNTDDLTNNTTPEFTGTCRNGETVTLYVDNVAILPTQVCSGGTYSITPALAIGAGNHTINSTFSDSNGQSSKSPTLYFTIDTSAPAAFTATINPLGAFSFTNPQFTFSTTDQSSITYSVSEDAGPFVTVTSPYVPSTAIDPSVTHHYVFRACDEFEACTDSHLYFYPSITINAPTVISNNTITDTVITVNEPTASSNFLNSIIATVSYEGGSATPVTLSCMPTIPGSGSEKTTDCSIVGGGISGPDGTYLLTVSADNSAAIPGYGQSSQLYTIDTVAPGLTINTPTHVSNAAITNTTITLTDANGIDTVNVTGGTLGTCTPTLPTSQTNVSVTCAITISATGTLDVTVYDLAGNSTNDTEPGYVIDPTSPVIGPVSVPSGATFGVSKTITFNVSDNYGILPAGVSATVGTTSCTAVNATTLNCSLAVLSNSVTIHARDRAGNNATPSVLSYTLISPVADIVNSSDTGVSNTDNITNDNTPTFSGICADGETVTLIINGGATTYSETCNIGSYSITPTVALADGAHIAEIQYSLGAVTSNVSNPLHFTIDTTSPTSPSITSPKDGEVDLLSPVIVSGTCISGTSVIIQPGNITTICLGGIFSAQVVFTASPQTISVIQEDPAGNKSPSSSITINNPTGAVLLVPNSGASSFPNLNQNISTNQNQFIPTANAGKTFNSPIDGKELACPGFTGYLKKGSRGGEVKLLQAFLNKSLGLKIPLTGYFGTMTESAVKQYQQRNKTTVMDPWGLKTPSGWFYQSTRFQANIDLTCSEGSIKLDNGKLLQ